MRQRSLGMTHTRNVLYTTQYTLQPPHHLQAPYKVVEMDKSTSPSKRNAMPSCTSLRVLRIPLRPGHVDPEILAVLFQSMPTVQDYAEREKKRDPSFSSSPLFSRRILASDCYT